MPLFEYKCSGCESRFEVLHKSPNNPEKVECPECHSTNVKKLLSTLVLRDFQKVEMIFPLLMIAVKQEVVDVHPVIAG